MCWEGELPFSALLCPTLTGVRKRLTVPHSLRMVINDKPALAHTAHQVPQWPFERVIIAHNAIVERDAHAGCLASRPGRRQCHFFSR
jgi:hypothetical protein